MKKVQLASAKLLSHLCCGDGGLPVLAVDEVIQANCGTGTAADPKKPRRHCAVPLGDLEQLVSVVKSSTTSDAAEVSSDDELASLDAAGGCRAGW